MTLTDFQHRARFEFPDVNADKLNDFVTEVYCRAYEQCMIDWDVMASLCNPLPYRPLPTATYPEEEETDFNCAIL